ncbi:ATP-grasp fold amidoligase family protein [Vibrio cyclitrophicus]|uniref:ATP-grasp fold amidoligase family protein n=1 Tax=Vibrio cyclitrophicus TaxID=47951 RepID=UPI0011B51DEA|nr:ATP-grasp fold amidoligase family protein [Vibrio cyclitrophicus]
MFLKIVFAFIRILDEIIFVRFLNYDNYFKLHQFLGFPLIRLLFYKSHGYALNLSNPSSFNEKLVCDKIKNRRKLYPIITDKFKVRSYVEDKIGGDYLIPLLGAYDNINIEILKSLDCKYILKTNHGSHQHFIVNDLDNVNYAEMVEKSNQWLAEKYRYQALVWFAQEIPRKIIIEKLMLDKDGKVPFDYKFFIFNGKVEFIQVDADRFSGHHRILYTSNWDKLNVDYLVDSGGKAVDRPLNLEKMIQLAEKLGEDFEFMRVDLYDLEGDIFFGELTPYPSAGYGPISPVSYDFELGNKIEAQVKYE